MHAAPLALLLSASVQADTAAAPVNFQTTLLVLLVVAVVFCARALSQLRSRLAKLEESHSASVSPHRPAAPAASSPIPVSTGPSPQVVAAIAAAIHVALGGRHRLVGITPAHDNHHVWSTEGRRQIFHSHRVR